MTASEIVNFTQMDVQDLRAWRAHTIHVETLVSYWRRLIQGRLDVLDKATSGQLNTEELTQVLAQHAMVSRGKINHVGATPTGVPDLPGMPANDLVGLWEEVPTVDTVTLLRDRLTRAEAALGDYRITLHGLLDRSAKELAARYLDKPEAVEHAWAARVTPPE